MDNKEGIYDIELIEACYLRHFSNILYYVLLPSIDTTNSASSFLKLLVDGNTLYQQNTIESAILVTNKNAIKR